MPSRFLYLSVLAAALLASPPALWSQPTDQPELKPNAALETLLSSTEAKKDEWVEAAAKLAAMVPTDPDRANQVAEVELLRAEYEDLASKFETLSTGVDPQSLDKTQSGAFDLVQEVAEVVEPVIRQLKSGTEGPRKIEYLKSAKRLANERIKIVDRALKTIDENIARSSEETLAALQELRATWKQRGIKYKNELDVAQFELQTTQESRISLVESMKEFIDDFFRNRGLNLLIALTSFLVVFLILRFVRQRVLKVLFRRGATFYSRLASVVLQILSVLAALGAMVIALFAVSDWVLLVVVLIFLVGIGWAGAKGLPQFFEQIRLLLNLGSVREKERVIMAGLPWIVDELKLYTILRNPDLSGGEYRIPIKDLVGLHSRPIASNEVWFPCREGDWVILGDSTRGRVVLQSPDMVQLVEPGGARKTYPTSDFLGQNPRNLSTNYRLQITFGIDYCYQAISTSEVPAIMAAAVQEKLEEILKPKELLSLVVEFKEANTSSLDYAVLADLAGSTAAQYDYLKRTISRILVDTCNKHDWVIPFTQITLHQA